MTINIGVSNDLPMLTMDSEIIVSEDSSSDLDFSVIDVDKDTVTPTIKVQPSKGTVAINGTTITYTPDSNYYGSDSFVISFSDGNGGVVDKSIDVIVNSI